MNTFTYIESTDTLSLVFRPSDGSRSKPYTFFKENKGYDSIKQAIEQNDERKFRFAVDRYLSFQQLDFNSSDIEVKGKQVFVQGIPVEHDVLRKSLMEFVLQDKPLGPVVKFIGRLRNNPSYDSINRLFACLEANHHPILHDGRFLAYKRIDKNFKDLYTHTIDNSIGSKPEVKRSEVDDDHGRTCSYGLHVASFNYARYSYGNNSENPLVLVAVDPADVVSVPADYNNQKMRVCKYEVLDIAPDEEIKDILYGIYNIDEEQKSITPSEEDPTDEDMWDEEEDLIDDEDDDDEDFNEDDDYQVEEDDTEEDTEVELPYKIETDKKTENFWNK